LDQLKREPKQTDKQLHPLLHGTVGIAKKNTLKTNFCLTQSSFLALFGLL
jgi:hypothetical protein